HLLLAPWYHRRMSAAIGAALPEPRARSLDVPAVVAAILASGRPLALTDSFLPQKIEARFPSYPIGTLIRVVPKASDVPDPLELEAQNLALAAAETRTPLAPA